MPFHYKAMILVMFITPIMFAMAKPLFTRFMSVEDFTLRRNIWLALTLAAFAIPDFWVYSLVACALMLYGVNKDSNPAAFYLLLLLVIPPVSKYVPGFGIVNYILQMNHLRLLSLVVLIPIALKLKNRPPAPAGDAHAGRVRAADVLIVLFVAAQVTLMAPYQAISASMRSVVELTITTLLPYFVVSRAIESREQLVDAMACFVLTVVVLIPLAVIETLRGWVLYVGIETRWEGPHMFANLMRGDLLRAQVSTGHSLVFGFALAVALGMWSFLQSRVDSRNYRSLALLTLITGLVAALARGPWMGALLIIILYAAMGPNASRRMAQTITVLVVVAGVTLASPYADKVLDYLPFVGTIDSANSTYRQQLATISWQLIQQNPVFGSPFYIRYMEELRQGEGIIDLVNSYAGLALSYGLLGAGLFVSFFLVIGWRCFREVRRFATFDRDMSLIGASLLACMMGMLFMIAGVSYYLSIPYVHLAVAGLMVAYVRIAHQYEPADFAQAVPDHEMRSLTRVQSF